MVVRMVVKAEMGVWFTHPFLMKKSFAADRLFGIIELLIGGRTPYGSIVIALVNIFWTRN